MNETTNKEIRYEVNIIQKDMFGILLQLNKRIDLPLSIKGGLTVDKLFLTWTQIEQIITDDLNRVAE
jgi:hypothetical protein